MSLGFNGYSGTEGRIDILHKAAIFCKRVKRIKTPKRPKEITGEFAFVWSELWQGWGVALKPQT